MPAGGRSGERAKREPGHAVNPGPARSVLPAAGLGMRWLGGSAPAGGARGPVGVRALARPLSRGWRDLLREGLSIQPAPRPLRGTHCAQTPRPAGAAAVRCPGRWQVRAAAAWRGPGQGPGKRTGDGRRAGSRERARSERPGGRGEPRAPRGGGSGHPVQAALKVTSRRRLHLGLAAGLGGGRGAAGGGRGGARGRGQDWPRGRARRAGPPAPTSLPAPEQVLAVKIKD